MLRIANTVGDIEVYADPKARRITACVSVPAPEDRGGRARCTWILSQLRDAPSDLLIEAYPNYARTPYTASISEANDNTDALLGEDKRELVRFRLVLTREMGANRKTGSRRPGFIDSVLDLIETIYGQVVQNIAPWTPKAPKITAPAATPASVDDDRPDDTSTSEPPPPSSTTVAKPSDLAMPPPTGTSWSTTPDKSD